MLHTRRSTSNDMRVDAGLLLGRSMQLLVEQVLDSTRTAGGDFTIVPGRDPGTLDSQGFVHDRTASSNELQVRDGAATGRLTSRGRKRTQSSGRGVLEEGAQALGLAEKSLHVVGVERRESQQVYVW